MPPPRPINPDHLNDADFLAWCLDDQVPLQLRGDVYLARRFEWHQVPTLTAEHRALWQAVQLAEYDAMRERGWLRPGTDDLTAAATVMLLDVIAVRHGS